MSGLLLEVPRDLRRGGLADDEQASVDSGHQLIQLICRQLGRDSLAGLEVLDMGCGTKLVQAILQHDLPVGRYVGFDVYGKMIDFLNDSVNDPRFSFHRLNTHNEMYNPRGEPLTATSRLPVPERSFDLICLFSVFTHLAPHDYVAMLKVLRRYVKPDGKVFFSLFVNEVTPGGHGFIDSMAPIIAPHLTTENMAWQPPDFVDWVPGRPLLRALYSRDHALRLVESAGWVVDSLNDPEECVQHYMICSPAA